MIEARILLVEDDRVTRVMLQAQLCDAGYAVISAESGEAALARLNDERFDLVITDLDMPKANGLTVMEAARRADPDLEVIVLTGVASIESAIAAVRHGAFAYIRKPGQPGELQASTQAALARRRERHEQTELLRQVSAQLLKITETRTSYSVNLPTPQPPSGNAIFRIGSLQIDTQRYAVTRGSEAIQLTRGEFSLLAYLAQRPEQVVSPRELARAVLDYNCSVSEARELVKARIHKLRQKIEIDPSVPRLLVSVRGVGYILTAGRS